MRCDQYLLLLLLWLLLAWCILLAIFTASLLASARQGWELGLILDGEVASAAYLALVQLRESSVGRLA